MSIDNDEIQEYVKSDPRWDVFERSLGHLREIYQINNSQDDRKIALNIFNNIIKQLSSTMLIEKELLLSEIDEDEVNPRDVFLSEAVSRMGNVLQCSLPQIIIAEPKNKKKRSSRKRRYSRYSDSEDETSDESYNEDYDNDEDEDNDEEFEKEDSAREFTFEPTHFDEETYESKRINEQKIYHDSEHKLLDIKESLNLDNLKVSKNENDIEKLKAEKNLAIDKEIADIVIQLLKDSLFDLKTLFRAEYEPPKEKEEHEGRFRGIRGIIEGDD